jgi:hypothetical protein
MEKHISSHLEVSAAIFIGTRRPRGVLQVEMRDLTMSDADAIVRTFSLIEEASNTVPPTARVEEELILFVEDGMLIKRTGKKQSSGQPEWPCMNGGWTICLSKVRLSSK